MALRLFLVGIVASLALDFPGEASPTDRPQVASVERSDRAMPNGQRAFAGGEEDVVAVAPFASVQTVTASEPIAMAEMPMPASLEDGGRGTQYGVERITSEPMPLPAPAPEVAVAPAIELPPAPAVEEMKRTGLIEIVELDEPAPVDPDAGFRGVVDGMVSAFVADATPPADVADVLADETDLDPALARIPGYELSEETPVDAKGCVEKKGAEIPAEAQAQPGRLSRAVRLTGLALNAWTGLLSSNTSGSSLRR